MYDITIEEHLGDCETMTDVSLQQKVRLGGSPVLGYVVVKSALKTAELENHTHVRKLFSPDDGYRISSWSPEYYAEISVETLDGDALDTRVEYSHILLVAKYRYYTANAEIFLSDRRLREVIERYTRVFLTNIHTFRKERVPLLQRTYCAWCMTNSVCVVPQQEDGRRWLCNIHGYLPESQVYLRMSQVFH